MFEQPFLSAVQFITALIAIAVALTGWVTLILANRRMRAERAILVIQEVRPVSLGGCQIVIENIGTRAALAVSVAIEGDTRIVAGGLRGGERLTVGLPAIGTVRLDFRDAIGSERNTTSVIADGADGPFIMSPTRSGWARRQLIRGGLIEVG